MNIYKIFKFIGEKNHNYSLDIVQENYLRSEAIPGKGYLDEKGKQGLWVTRYFYICKEEIEYVDDVRNGKCIIYDNRGLIEKEKTYKDGELNGRYVTYKYNGDILIDSMWENGELISYERF